MMEGGMMGWGMGFGGLWMLLLLVGLIVLVVWVVRLLFPQNGNTSVSEGVEENAKDIAERRYAKGEISREEYESIKQDLA